MKLVAERHRIARAREDLHARAAVESVVETAPGIVWDRLVEVEDAAPRLDERLDALATAKQELSADGRDADAGCIRARVRDDEVSFVGLELSLVAWLNQPHERVYVNHQLNREMFPQPHHASGAEGRHQ